jgi:hypothetical protein
MLRSLCFYCQLSTSPTTTNSLARCELYADLDTRLLICCQPSCGFAHSTVRSQVNSHLRDKHSVSRGLTLRDGLTHRFRHVHPFVFVGPAPPRPDGLHVHLKLRLGCTKGTHVELASIGRSTGLRDVCIALHEVFFESRAAHHGR